MSATFYETLTPFAKQHKQLPVLSCHWPVNVVALDGHALCVATACADVVSHHWNEPGTYYHLLGLRRVHITSISS